MKQKLFLLTVLVVLLQVVSFGQGGVSRGFLPVVAEEGISSIIVGDNIDVLLIPVGSDLISAKVARGDEDKVEARVFDTHLYLNVTKKLAPGERLAIFIKVEDINKLVLKGNATAISRGVLNCRNLKIIMDQEGRASLRTSGKIVVDAPRKYEVSKTENYSYFFAAE
jgi:hypothetical protein